ncbi:MAG: DUF4982 domain-containing protein, partial [Clostridiales bacterium]|nr:DUF4982 domain-containing protein [Clostridiales bacterium]
MKKENFNAGWIVTEVGSAAMKAGNRQVTLPHDAMVYTEKSPDSVAGAACGWYKGGNYEYTKKFRLDESEKGKTVILEFEGIYNRGYVYVNGCFAGSVHYGYTRLILDITPYICYEAENEVRVKVINADAPNSRWYTGSGLYRPVNIYVGGDVRIAVDGLRISSIMVDEDVSEINAEVRMEYDGKTQKTVRLELVVKDVDGAVVAGENRPIILVESGRTVIDQHIYIRNVRLWSPDEPNLYTCEAKLTDGETVLDTVEVVFGIRSVTIDPVYGMRINGKRILLRGGCIHHDNGPVGAATFARAEERRVEIMKRAGFNAIRTSHNTASKALLDACDRIGMLVIDESYDMWNQSMSTYDYSLDFADHWERDLEDFTAKDFNHPSVIMYSIGNEIPEVGTPDGEDWNRKLAQKVHELDPTRLVTNAINGMLVLMRLGSQGMDLSSTQDNLASEEGINDVMTEMMGKMNDLAAIPVVADTLEATCSDLDLSGYNYMRGVYDIYKEQYPNRIFYGSETCPPDIDLNWSKVKSIPACIGDFTWTAWEYIGEAGVGVVDYDRPTAFMEPYPVYLAYCSDIDLIGDRRPMSYYREIVFGLRKEPYISVELPEHYGEKAGCTPWVVPESVSSWSWNGSEGKPCMVEVYSDAEEVELFVNGSSCGKQPAGEENRFKAFFDVTYMPGEVKAVAYRNGQAAETYAIETAKDDVILQICADRTDIGANDIAYLAVSLTDADGILQIKKDRRVKVTVEGVGALQGLASAD